MATQQYFTTFDIMRPHFDALSRVGYFKIVLKNISPTKRNLHNAFRVLSWILVLTYNLQHFMKVYMSRHNTDDVVDILFILLTTLNTLGKEVAFNARSARVDTIVQLIDGPDFAVKLPYHVLVMKSNGLVMSKLLKLYHTAVILCGILWSIFPVVNRVLGERVEFTGYFPFDTSSNVAFGLAHAYMSLAITFQAYGNVTMDCTIVALLSQARTQIQILRYNLEQADSKINRRITKGYNERGIHKDEYCLQRLIQCVEHHKKIVWFVKEIESIFNEAMVMQFIAMAWVICMTVYKIASLSIVSAEFVSMTVYLGCMLAQLFIYCYFGTQLTIESEYLNQSVYNSGWVSFSPRFRRHLLIMMQFASIPIAPRTAYIVPLSLDTYMKVLKSSYTLFTFLTR